MKAILTILALLSITEASNAPAEIGVTVPADYISRGECGMARATDPLSFSLNPANSIARTWIVKRPYEVSVLHSQLLPVLDEEIDLYTTGFTGSIPEISWLRFGYMFSKLDFGPNIYGSVEESNSHRINISVGNSLVAAGINYNRFSFGSNESHTSYAYRSIDFGYAMHKRIGKVKYIDFSVGNNFQNILEKPDRHDLAIGKDYSIGTTISGGIENYLEADINTQLNYVRKTIESKRTFSNGFGVTLLDGINLMLGYMKDDPKDRSEFHYGWGIEFAYQNIKRLLKNQNDSDEKKIDFGIKWVHSVIRDANSPNYSVRENQSANQLNAFINTNI